MQGDEAGGSKPAASGPSAPSGDGIALPAGATLAEFEILRVLGKGGFGIVYLAFDRSLRRQVAIKEYLPTSFAMRKGGQTVVVRSAEHQATFESGLKSFIDEARLLAQFDHPSLVKVHRFWEANGTAYMAMPYYQGSTLQEILKADPKYATEARLKALLTPLLDAVGLLHAQHCYHRDVSPDNIIIQPDGTPVLLDFGAARRIIGDMTHALTVMLKPGYAPIEQYAEEGGLEQGPWTDVYAFAAVLFRAISGERPPPGVGRAYRDTLVPLHQRSPPGYSQQFLRGIDRALAVRPEDRPQSVAELRDALGIGTGDDNDKTVYFAPASRPVPASGSRVAPQPGAAAAADVGSAPNDGARRRLLGLGAGAAVVVGVAIVLAVYLTTGADSPAPAERAGATSSAPTERVGATSSAPTERVGATSSTPAERVAATSPAPAPQRSDPRARIAAALAALDCAKVAFELDEAGRLTLRGRVQDAQQRTGLQQVVGGMEGVKSVTAEVVFVPRPYCEVVGSLESLGNTSGGGSLGVRVVRPPPPLRIGQQGVTLEVTGPDFPAHITVDVWSLAEREPRRMEVSHLLPHAGYSLSDRFRANERKSIDRIADGKSAPVRIAVMPPPGHLLITAIASDHRLVEREQALEGNPDAHLAALRAAATGRATDGRIATWHGLVEVRP